MNTPKLMILLLLFFLPLLGCDSDSSDNSDKDQHLEDSSEDQGEDSGDSAQADLEDQTTDGEDGEDKLEDQTEGPESSGGSGGLTCSSQGNVSVEGTSYTYCVVTVDGVELKIVEPSNAEGPLHLAIYFHGDGAGPYHSDYALKKHAPFTANNTLYVAALAPNGCTWWLAPDYTTCDINTPIPDSAIDRDGENAVALAGVIEALRGGWDILDESVMLGGSSGGSIFLTASFLPMQGEIFPGYYALSCGGAAPWAGEMVWEASQDLRAETKLSFTYGDKDFVVPDVEEGLSFYQGLGFEAEVMIVPEDVAEGSSHCGNIGGSYSYDQLGRIVEMWQAQLDAQ